MNPTYDETIAFDDAIPLRDGKRRPRRGKAGQPALRCRFRIGGVQCSAYAVTRDGGKARCALHACGTHTRTARIAFDDE